MEFLSIFIAVISAFALNNWNDNRKEAEAESKILTEILNGLEKDKNDLADNLQGHEIALLACGFWRDVINDVPRNTDTLTQFYFSFTRDYVSIQNTSGYETLKSRGFEIIENDDLRAKILSLYEFQYQVLRKLEEEYAELQFHNSYFLEFNEVIAPHFVFDATGNIQGMNLPLNLSESKKKTLLSYLWKIKTNREFIMHIYDRVKGKITALEKEIKAELSSN